MSIQNQYLLDFLKSQTSEFYNKFNRGLERESLRIMPEGKLSSLNHPSQLGSALTNSHITTDYSESLLEFITPVESNISTSLSQLSDVQKFTYQHINGELLWPMSMPCFVGGEDDIRIAQYGDSNVGKMKTLYREGLRHRYGSMMQVISGVHFNFSFPDDFWRAWCQSKSIDYSQDAVSNGYLAVIRNLKRHIWMLPYLFGASPALCSSFIAGKDHKLPFEKVGKGTLYLPYATSLRLSDLGYTNSAQADLNIKYNHLGDYISGLRRAINLPSKEFAHIGVKQDGVYKQLNANVLQIENEFYSSIRPKRVAESGEKPTDALESKGIQYIEVRALDVDPFSFEGVSAEQIHFMDLLLTWCALNDSPLIQDSEDAECEANIQKVIIEGRNPKLQLAQNNNPIKLTDWAQTILAELAELAMIMDASSGGSAYKDAIIQQQNKVSNPELTPSGQIMATLLAENMDNGVLGMRLAKQYKAHAEQINYGVYTESQLTQEAKASQVKQHEIEASDLLSFDEFLADYFAEDQEVAVA